MLPYTNDQNETYERPHKPIELKNQLLSLINHWKSNDASSLVDNELLRLSTWILINKLKSEKNR
jgi:hypothetical protein